MPRPDPTPGDVTRARRALSRATRRVWSTYDAIDIDGVPLGRFVQSASDLEEVTSLMTTTCQQATDLLAALGEVVELTAQLRALMSQDATRRAA